HLFIRRGSGGLQGKIDRPVEQLGRKEFHRGRFEANVEALVGLPGAVVSDDAKRLQLTAQMAERSREPVALTPSRREQPGNPAQDSQRGTVGANAHLKAPRAEPGLVQFPAFPYFAQDLAFRNAASVEHQFARLTPRDRLDAAHDAITGMPCIDEEAADPFAASGSWQAAAKPSRH